MEAIITPNGQLCGVDQPTEKSRKGVPSTVSGALDRREVAPPVPDYVLSVEDELQVAPRREVGDTHRSEEHHSDVLVKATWGCDGTTLGSVQMYANFQITGAQTASKPVYYYNTSGSQQVVFTGDLINAAPSAVGSEVSGAFSLYNAGTVPAAIQIAWNPNGSKSYDNKN